MLLTLPVRHVFLFESRKLPQSTVIATRLAFEIGYYEGDMPEMIFNAFGEQVTINNDSAENKLSMVPSIGGVVMFNRSCEELIQQRDEEIVFFHTPPRFNNKREKVLHTIIDDLRIPYEGISKQPKRIRPDLTLVTQVEIQYQPSMLEYFFPYTSQQRLLSAEEKEYLQSGKTIIKDPKWIAAIANDIEKAKTISGGFIRYSSKADMTCYYDGKPSISFSICNSDAIISEAIIIEGLPLTCKLKSLWMLTPQIQSLDLRMQCAENLKDQWYRFRFYKKAATSLFSIFSGRILNKHLKPEIWCDAMELAYTKPYVSVSSEQYEREMKLNICPSAEEGKSHYAMNPNCKPDSPGDMVLLFETKAGWNQHGGPELFTFDNHNPKGGCVLLNDGTVNFIRTEEELKNLRWK